MQKIIKDVFINASGSFLPGSPIPNEKIEDYLGLVNEKPSRYKKRILSVNKIESRHYALDSESNITHLTEELAELAIRDALTSGNINIEDVSYLSSGTTFPDLLAPGFASMIHGRIGSREMEIATCGGICGSGVTALKSAVNAIRLGEHKIAVSVAAERLSRLLLGDRFKGHTKEKDIEDGFHYFNGEFLRWMLSDGAGALIVSDTPSSDTLSLKVDWINVRSFAHKLPVCMFMGTESLSNYGPSKTWLDKPVDEEILKNQLILRQNHQLLTQHHATAFEEHIKSLHENGDFIDSEVSWYLPHMSSHFFEDRIHQGMIDSGVNIPKDKWFSNLATKGNTGAASIYIAIDECLKKNKFKRGDKILCFIPESGRFLSSFIHLTAV